MRLARKNNITLKKLIKRATVLDTYIENSPNNRIYILEKKKLNAFIKYWDRFRFCEELICCKHNGEYMPYNDYMNSIISEYEQGYVDAIDLFVGKAEYIGYALENHFKDEDVEFIMLKPNMEVI